MRCPLRHLLLLVLAIWAGLMAAPFAQEARSRAPDRPEAIGEASWMRRLAEHQGQLTNGRFNVVFIGDSLTDFWAHTGRAMWDAELAPLKCMNCGIAGDRTEHILYRISRLDFRRASPKAFVLMMGTNNLGMESPDQPNDVAHAIVKAADALAKRHPQSRIFVLEVPPSGYEPDSPLRRGIRATNTLLAKAKLPTQASLITTYDLFVDGMDRWKPVLTLDGTHFSAAGYAVLAKRLVPRLEEGLGLK